MLKVMTLNLNYYVARHGPWDVRREIIREAIQAAAPDIIALQAVREDPQVVRGLDQASQLRQALPEYKHIVFHSAMEFEDGSVGGSAFLSRLRIAEADHIELTLLPGLEDNNRRELMHARFDLPEGPLHLFNAYLSWVEKQTRYNLREILPYLRMFKGPALLLGDMNTPAGTDILKPLEEAGWVDLWSKLRPDEPGYTFEAGEPKIRIDYAWANPDLAPKAAGIDLIANTQDERGARPSDHYGLLVSLNIEHLV